MECLWRSDVTGSPTEQRQIIKSCAWIAKLRVVENVESFRAERQLTLPYDMEAFKDRHIEIDRVRPVKAVPLHRPEMANRHSKCRWI